jgi:hypothetical protein
MTRPVSILDQQFDPIEGAPGMAGQKVGPARGSTLLDAVDLLASDGAETPAPRAARDQAEFPAAAITLVHSHD